MRIYLIGMPGSGKTTVAKILAQKLNYVHCDLDVFIENMVNLKITDIFSTAGEIEFRRLETETLKSFKMDNSVISCGGGIVTKIENKQYMDGLIFYLKTDIKLLQKRLEKDVSRPLLQKKSIEQLYDERCLQYEAFSNVTINNYGNSSKVAAEIYDYIKKEVEK